MEPNISAVAGLIGEPARSSMLLALMGGKALTATELALEAGITAQTASSHLRKLVKGQLLTVRKQGRHKYFQLSNHEVAELLEKLLNISAHTSLPAINTGPKDPMLRTARICYDHLAGEIGVALYDALMQSGHIINHSVDHPHELLLAPPGRLFFQTLGLEFEDLEKNKRALCKSCLDWSERRNHLAGSLGKWVLGDLLTKKWAKKDLNTRAILFTDTGLMQFKKQYGIPS